MLTTAIITIIVFILYIHINTCFIYYHLHTYDISVYIYLHYLFTYSCNKHGNLFILQPLCNTDNSLNATSKSTKCHIQRNILK